MMGLRLLPVVLFALTSLLILKGVDLLGRGGLEVTGPAPAYAGADAADAFETGPLPADPLRPVDHTVTGTVAKKDDVAPSADSAPKGAEGQMAAGSDAAAPPPEPATAGTEGAPAQGDGAATPGKPVETAPPLLPLASTSPSERALLERLQSRREQLDQQARELDMRENLLKAAEKRIEERIGELKQIEASVGTAQQRKDDEVQVRMKSLVIMYEAMKPKDAARIFDKLDLPILVDVVTAMKPAKVADVLAAMDPQAAQRLTVELANKANPKTAAPDPAPGGDLPKIEGESPNG